jgi:hypothetical protein
MYYPLCGWFDEGPQRGPATACKGLQALTMPNKEVAHFLSVYNRNSRAFASLTARDGGLPYPLELLWPRVGKRLLKLASIPPAARISSNGYSGSLYRVMAATEL